MRKLLRRFKKRLFRIEQIARYLKNQDDLLLATQEAFVMQLLNQPRYQEPERLARYERQVFSRHGNDGIIHEIFERIGTRSRTFVEIGCGDGLENNTTNLLREGWRGYWFDGSPRNVSFVQEHFRNEIDAGALSVKSAFLDSSNAVSLLRHQGVPTEFDILSVDIDRNTYYIWAALAEFRPRVVVIEYNSKLLPSTDWKVEYDPGKAWDGTAYFGASLKAFELLGRKLGYSLVGSDLTGVDAFFVRDDQELSRFAKPFTAENHHEPPRYFLVRAAGHPNSFRD